MGNLEVYEELIPWESTKEAIKQGFGSIFQKKI